MLSFTKSLFALSLCVLVLSLCACSDAKKESNENASGGASAADPLAGLFLDSEPSDAAELVAVKKSSKAGEEVTLRCRIGGRAAPFVETAALMMVMDLSMNPCTDACPVPWDYCCDTQEDITAHSASIQVVDAKGKVLKKGINGLKGLAPNAELVVKGKVFQNEEGGQFIINATGIFVKKAS